jgi:hypothetical protein
MISGLVFFEELVQSFKDETGIENAQNYYEKLARIIFDAEEDIGYHGTIVPKIKTYTKGSEGYDGSWLPVPYDFTGEYHYAAINTGRWMGNGIKLYEDGPDSVDLKYMGFMTDSYGQPVTTMNHKRAVVARMVWKMYARKVFMGQGDRQQLRYLKRDYEDLVMASRGHDAFPTEEELSIIGETLRTPTSQLITLTCGQVEDPYADILIGGSTTAPPGSGDADCGDLTVDMVAVFEANLT